MGTEKPVAVYWDASAILSALLKDEHSKGAQKWANRSGHHFLSHLSYSEVVAVLSRIRRERDMAEILVDAAGEVLENGPWRRLYIVPQGTLSRSYPINGRSEGLTSGIYPPPRAFRNNFRSCNF